MKWLMKDPAPGDMIRVKAGEIYHYGVFVSEEEVIQFGPTPSERLKLRNDEIKVISTDIDAFLVGGFLEVAEFDRKEKKKNRSPKDTIAYARENLGRGGYNILYNNCEHFATECVTGRALSSQTDHVRALFRKMPVVDVFTAEIPEECTIDTVYPMERDDEIKAVSNERVKREKYCAWKLLKYAMERSLGIKMENICFSKDENGKWSSPACYFSISHSGSLVAVAVSRAPVGIDIEAMDAPMRAESTDRLLTCSEREDYLTCSVAERQTYLVEKWAAKEAIFKKDGQKNFVPAEITIKENELYKKELLHGGKGYFCFVATQTPEKVRCFEEIPPQKFL